MLAPVGFGSAFTGAEVDRMREAWLAAFAGDGLGAFPVEAARVLKLAGAALTSGDLEAVCTTSWMYGVQGAFATTCFFCAAALVASQAA